MVSDPMALMLIGAAAIYALTAEYRNAIILGAAALPVLLADVILEAQSRSALKKLAHANASRAHVIRDGREGEIAGEEIVVGDLLVLREGDLVHADAIVRWSANLTIDESQLTGESEPQVKTSSSIAAAQPDENSVYSGSLVVSGHGYAEVYATGPRTRFAKIAQLLATTRQGPAPLERKVARITRWLVLIAVTIAAVIFVLRFHATGRGIESILYAIGVAISSVPEEFPLVLTLLLSVGAYRLSRQGVLVRRLSCVETLGATTIICLDKTGTLTIGRFALVAHESFDPNDEAALLENAVLACELDPADPMERAIFDHCREHQVDIERLHRVWTLVRDHPFDPLGRHMSHVWHRTVDGKPIERVVAKGAAEGILSHCSIDPGRRQAILQTNADLAAKGLRVLAVADRQSENVDHDAARETDEQGLKFRGFLAFEDPVRPSVAGAIAECQRAGIRLKMITGDHPLTAHAVAESAGLLHDDRDLMTGADLDRLTPAELAEAASRCAIFARVRPEQKFAIVDALVRAGEIVAMTGDGVNDAPALRRADIGVSLGRRGTEVARSAAAMVLLEDDLGALVGTVREGRVLFGNIQTAFSFLTGFKTMIVSLALLAPVLGLPPLLLLLEIVWLELIVHLIATTAFQGQSDAAVAMSRPPRDPSLPVLGFASAAKSGLSGLMLTCAALVLYVWKLPEGIEYARGIGIAVVVLGSTMLCAIELLDHQKGAEILSLRFGFITAAAVVSLIVALVSPAISNALQIRPIGYLDWVAVSAAAAVFNSWRLLVRRPESIPIRVRPLEKADLP